MNVFVNIALIGFSFLMFQSFGVYEKMLCQKICSLHLHSWDSKIVMFRLFYNYWVDVIASGLRSSREAFAQ